MTIRTPNDAFIDLRLKSCERCTVANHPADAADFRSVDVVEVENEHVALAAVDARMVRKVRQHVANVRARTLADTAYSTNRRVDSSCDSTHRAIYFLCNADKIS